MKFTNLKFSYITSNNLFFEVMTNVFKMFVSWYGVRFWSVRIVSMIIQSMNKRCFVYYNNYEAANHQYASQSVRRRI